MHCKKLHIMGTRVWVLLLLFFSLACGISSKGKDLGIRVKSNHANTGSFIVWMGGAEHLLLGGPLWQNV